MMRFMRTEVVVAKGKPLSPGNLHKLEKENQKWTLIIYLACLRGVFAEHMWKGNCRSHTTLTADNGSKIEI